MKMPVIFTWFFYIKLHWVFITKITRLSIIKIFPIFILKIWHTFSISLIFDDNDSLAIIICERPTRFRPFKSSQKWLNVLSWLVSFHVLFVLTISPLLCNFELVFSSNRPQIFPLIQTPHSDMIHRSKDVWENLDFVLIFSCLSLVVRCEGETPGDNVGLIEAVNINITNMMDITHYDWQLNQD